jgi:hypothetical protein
MLDGSSYTPAAPIVHTVPTELERSDAFFDVAAMAGTLLLAYCWVSIYALPWQIVALPVVAVLAWALTGEPACDVPYIGAVAAGLRSKLGQRRIHEWTLAWQHYFTTAVLPVWRAHCYRFSRSVQRRIKHWLTRLSEATRWLRSRVFSRG